MKKYLVILVLALCAAVQSNAQTTWNVRAGGGLFVWYDDDAKRPFRDVSFSPMVALETNIPFTRGSKWCISPSIIYAPDIAEMDLSLPIHIGYKIPLRNLGILIPKVGPVVGIVSGYENLLFGPSVELAYEYKHFITTLNAACGTVDAKGPHVYLSIGYKF